jgi:membrane protein
MRRLFSLLRQAAQGFSRDNCGFLAQALAFNAMFALFPIAVLILAIMSLVFPNADQGSLLFLATLAPPLHDFIAANLSSYIYGKGISSIVAVVILIWSGKNLFLGLTTALDRALGIPVGRPFMHHLALSLVMLPVSAILLIVAIGLPVLFSIAMSTAHLPDYANLAHVAVYITSILLVFAVSLVIYAILPDRKPSLDFALPGAAFVAGFWPLIQYAFALYTIHVNFTKIYGVLSAPLALLLWFYVIAAIFLFGAELCGARAKANYARK